MPNVPVYCNLLWTNQDAARKCPKGDIKLAFCPVCGHIMNIAFEPNLLNYGQVYENPLDYSPRFQAYGQSLAEELVELYGLNNKDIISIGCGKGVFLSMLCELGNNRGVGFDPSLQEKNMHLTVNSKIKLIKDYYSERYANYHGDLIVCRQMLEHIFDPKSFLKMLRHIIGKRLNTAVFFEVPNALNIFQKFFVWDIIYEHYSYFTPFSLSRVFSLSGFRVCDLAECFEGQFLGIHVLPSCKVARDFNAKPMSQINQIASYITSFAASYRSIVKKWRRKLEKMENKGQRVVIWGTGSKGVTFLNTFKNSNIEYAVDINPEKQGKYVAGTGQQIVSSDFLQKYKPDVIIIMNPIYEREIRQFTKNLGLSMCIEHSIPSSF